MTINEQINGIRGAKQKAIEAVREAVKIAEQTRANLDAAQNAHNWTGECVDECDQCETYRSQWDTLRKVTSDLPRIQLQDI